MEWKANPPAAAARLLGRLLRPIACRGAWRTARNRRAPGIPGSNTKRRFHPRPTRWAWMCWIDAPRDAAAQVIPMVAFCLPSLPVSHADVGRRLPGGARRFHRSVTSQEGRESAGNRPRSGCFIPTDVLWPLRSRARQRQRGSVTRVFCIRAWYWNKISRLGLTHCGGLGSIASLGRSRR